MANGIDMLNQRFGRLLVIERAPRPGDQWHWLCACDCGGSTVVAGYSLRHNMTVSCGCFIREYSATHKRTHGQSKTLEYQRWRGMLKRCHTETDKAYPGYGGRGITVCDRWRGPHGFANFFSDMGPRPSGHHSLDRIDNDGNYEPSNCRWATPDVQSRNRRNVKVSTDDLSAFVEEVAKYGARHVANVHGISRNQVNRVLDAAEFRRLRSRVAELEEECREMRRVLAAMPQAAEVTTTIARGE